jgi:hypothetical protein
MGKAIRKMKTVQLENCRFDVPTKFVIITDKSSGDSPRAWVIQESGKFSGFDNFVENFPEC